MLLLAFDCEVCAIVIIANDHKSGLSHLLEADLACEVEELHSVLTKGVATVARNCDQDTSLNPWPREINMLATFWVDCSHSKKKTCGVSSQRVGSTLIPEQRCARSFFRQAQ